MFIFAGTIRDDIDVLDTVTFRILD
jgi:hypothetical protein